MARGNGFGDGCSGAENTPASAVAAASQHLRGAVLKATDQPFDTGVAAGKCFLDMLGVFAEFETNLRRERQLEGIAKAKAAGVYKGRPPSIEPSRVRELKAQGMRPVDIAKALKIGRASVYRVLGSGGH
jgi:DNA invertase Pin-like site-specific DNA recombinase